MTEDQDEAFRSGLAEGAHVERMTLATWLRHPFHVEAGGALVGEIFQRLATMVQSGLHYQELPPKADDAV